MHVAIPQLLLGHVKVRPNYLGEKQRSTDINLKYTHETQVSTSGLAMKLKNFQQRCYFLFIYIVFSSSDLRNCYARPVSLSYLF